MTSLVAIHARRTWWLLTAALLFSELACAQTRVELELHAGRDFQGPLHYATIDDSGTAWVAAPSELYRIEHGRAVHAGSIGGAGSRLLLAPRGERLARLSRGKSRFGRFTVDLVDPNQPGITIATLQSPGVPSAFAEMFVGRRGDLLVTSTPLDNAESLRGRFTYVFWSAAGQFLGSLTLPGPRMGVFDENGSAILLFGESGATAVGQDGSALWALPGVYRQGVLAAGGDVAVLNPAAAINEVHVVDNGRVAIAKLAAPVHALAVTPNGSRAAIATEGGRLHTLDVRECLTGTCAPIVGPALPFLGTYHVSDLRFLDRETLAVGTFEVTGSPPDERYEVGSIAVVTLGGRIKLRRSIRLPQPATWSPLLNVAYGKRSFVAYTRETAFLIRVGN